LYSRQPRNFVSDSTVYMAQAKGEAEPEVARQRTTSFLLAAEVARPTGIASVPSTTQSWILHLRAHSEHVTP
jgi:hypothetical protein